METEFEVKILDIDVDKIRETLGKIGAKKICIRNMRRYTYDFPDKDPNKWIRLRDDGEKVMLTIKEIHNEKIDGTKETEIVVNDFEVTHEIMNKLGYEFKNYQENKRESYLLDGVNIEIDFWPKISPYLEIEGKNAEEVESTVKKLGFSMKQTSTANTFVIFEKHGIDLLKTKVLKF
jgi:adenylate cyclase class 2